MRPVCLIIRDGWGYSEKKEGNAVIAARTPNIDRYKDNYPWTLLECAGEPVGLPDGYQGSSEVGHLNMGAGRIVIQELKRIDDGLRTGELFEVEHWKKLIANWKEHKSRLHLFGLLQDEGVHAHQEHLFKIMRRARQEYPGGPIIIHPFLDGRDTPPRSCMGYLAKLKIVMAGTIAWTVPGTGNLPTGPIIVLLTAKVANPPTQKQRSKSHITRTKLRTMLKCLTNIFLAM